MKRLIFMIPLVLFFYCAWSQFDFNPAAIVPLDSQVRTGKLPNGLSYFIQRNIKPAKRVELRLAVKVGSTMENDNQQGLAHFTEHMCFNGTRNFPGNQLITYFESKGIKFGKDLNAYTGFDETVYRITIPTDSTEVFNKGITLLKDWAGGVLMTNEEIEKERGVIIEEWRLGQGAGERMRDKYWPVLFQGSKYAERLPIGKKEIIESFNPSVLRDFYHDWYRPDLLAIVITGDINVDEIEKMVISQFSDIPMVVKPRKVEDFPVPDHREMRISKVTDKEATGTSVSIYHLLPSENYSTVGDMRRQIVYRIYNSMINNRLGELQKQADPPFLMAYCFYSDLVKTKNSYTSQARVKEKGVMKGLQSLVTENERVRRYGFTPGEFERTKKEIIRSMESAFAERNKTESSVYAGNLVDHFLNNSPEPGIRYELELYKKFLGEITLEEVNNLSKVWISDGENTVVVITGTEKAEIPSDSAILAVFKSVREEKLEAYKDEVLDKPLVSTQPKPSKVIKTEENTELGITVWKLENGVSVVLKQTDFKNDQVLFSGFSNGGTSVYPLKDDLSASYASAIISRSGIGPYNQVQLQKYLKGKIVNVNPVLNELTEEFRGSSSPADIETLLQMVYLYFTEPRKDSVAFLSLLDQQKGLLENRSADPRTAFNDTITVTMAGYSPYRMPMTVEKLKMVNLGRSYEIFRQSYSDASDFTFCFVGNFDKQKIRPLVEQYLGGLPVTHKKTSWKDLGIRPPKGIISKTVKKGVDQKASVSIIFSGPLSWTLKDKFDLNAMMLLVNIRLREAIREEKGGTYGIRATSNPVHFPVAGYFINISFGCDPQRVEELISAVMSEIERIIKEGATPQELSTIREQLLREREVNMKENYFWLNAVTSAYTNGDDINDMLKFNGLVNNLKQDDLKNAAGRYFNMKNYGRFVLLPAEQK